MVQKKSLLVVDGYNVMLATPRYEELLDERGSSAQETAAERAYHLNTDPFYRARLALISDVATFAQETAAERAYHLNSDPFYRARLALISDVATFAHGAYEAVIVFDGKGNVNKERPERSHAGVQLVFSETGESADSVIERLVTEAREAGRKVFLVTSDRDIRATAGFGPGEVTRIASTSLVHEISQADNVVEEMRRDQVNTRMTLEDRISPEQREKLWKLLGR